VRGEAGGGVGVATASTHLRDLFKAHGYPTYSALERKIGPTFENQPDGWLDDELRGARNRGDLPSLVTIHYIAERLGISPLEVIAEAAKDARLPLAPEAGIEGRLAADLIARVPHSQQMRFYGLMQQIVVLMAEEPTD